MSREDIEFRYDHPYTRLEFDWVAIDTEGFMGYLVTAGAGPIPTASLIDAKHLEDIFERVMRLKVVCEATVLTALSHNVSNWIEIARRGIYAFDWRRETRGYELIAMPESPVEANALSDKVLVQLAGKVRLSVRFADKPKIPNN